MLNKFNSKSRKKPNSKLGESNLANQTSVNVVNNKNTINNFHNEILQQSARKVGKRIDAFDNQLNTLTINNTLLDYGTNGASADNFEIMVYGLHIPGDYTIKEVGNDVVIKLNNYYIDYDNVTIDDIYVIGKFK